LVWVLFFWFGFIEVLMLVGIGIGIGWYMNIYVYVVCWVKHETRKDKTLPGGLSGAPPVPFLWEPPVPLLLDIISSEFQIRLYNWKNNRKKKNKWLKQNTKGRLSKYISIASQWNLNKLRRFQCRNWFKRICGFKTVLNLFMKNEILERKNHNFLIFGV